MLKTQIDKCTNFCKLNKMIEKLSHLVCFLWEKVFHIKQSLLVEKLHLFSILLYKSLIKTCDLTSKHTHKKTLLSRTFCLILCICWLGRVQTLASIMCVDIISAGGSCFIHFIIAFRVYTQFKHTSRMNMKACSIDGFLKALMHSIWK